MTRFRSEEVFESSVEEVFAWHNRPGPLVRLWPPWSGRVVREPSDGLTPGSEAVLRLAVPGTFGKVGVEWLAEHVDLDAPNYFCDVMASGPLKSWRHEHRFEAVDGGDRTRITDDITYQLPVPSPDFVGKLLVNPTLARTFAYRTRQLRGDLAFHADHPGPRLTVAVAGASGTIGTQLCALLSTGGHEVLRLVRRRSQSTDEISWDPQNGTLDLDALAQVDVVVHLGGHTIGGRFNRSNKKAMYDSRIQSTALLADAVARLSRSGHRIAFVCGSAIGYYGFDRGDQTLNEGSGDGSGFLAGLCRDWESATAAASDAGARVVNVRTGIVQTPASGALAKQLPLFQIGMGGPLGTGDQWMSWISIDDIVGAFAHAALSADVSGPLNAAAPNPVTARDYAKTLGRVLRRPAFVPVPAFGPELLLGREGAKEVVTASQRVDSSKLEESGYRFRHPTLEEALRHVLGR